MSRPFLHETKSADELSLGVDWNDPKKMFPWRYDDDDERDASFNILRFVYSNNGSIISILIQMADKKREIESQTFSARPRSSKFYEGSCSWSFTILKNFIGIQSQKISI